MAAATLTRALEDYLETIYGLLRGQPVARVRDIARERGVRAASVTPAVQRLAQMGLIRYERREYISLTPLGEEAARRVFSRHQLLTRLFSEVLGMGAKQAEVDACAMEHNLSSEAMDRLTRLFEFIRSCPRGEADFLPLLHGCPVFTEGARCDRRCQGESCASAAVTLATVAPGLQVRVERVDAVGAIRRRLLDMGFLPGTELRVERRAPSGDPLWLRMDGFQVSLRKAEAAAVRVVPLSAPDAEDPSPSGPV